MHASGLMDGGTEDSRIETRLQCKHFQLRFGG